MNRSSPFVIPYPLFTVRPDLLISRLCWVVTVVSFVFFFTIRPSPEIDIEQKRLIMKIVIGVIVLVILLIAVGAGLTAHGTLRRVSPINILPLSEREYYNDVLARISLREPAGRSCMPPTEPL
jgi:hypothetical protein